MVFTYHILYNEDRREQNLVVIRSKKSMSDEVLDDVMLKEIVRGRQMQL